MSILSQFKQSQNTDFPNVRPSLDLRFALAKKLDPRITFSRGSTGTYFGSDGLMRTAGVNEPRFDHDPVTGQSLGLLVEESRSNLITYSNDFSNATWSKGNVSITANNIVAPDGTLTADKLVENNTNNQHLVYKNITGSNETVTFSVFAKAGERTILTMQLSNFLTEAILFNFNLLLGTKSNAIGGGSDYTNSSASIIPYPNGWYRCIITSTKGAAVNTVNNPTLSTNTNFGGISIYTGDGTSGIYIWGAQVEQGALPTSYIPTTASTVTRSADNASMTGTNFSSWYNQSEGSIISSCICRRPNSGNGADFAITNSFTTTYTSRIVGWFNNSTTPLFAVVANNNIVFLPFVGVSNNQTNIPIKKAISLADKNMRVSTNGKLITGDLGNTGVQDYLPNDFNRLLIGYEGIFASYLNGTISRLTYYPIQLTNQQLINLTS